MKVKLSRPCKMGDKEITALDLDLEGLTGEDLVKAEREFLASNAGFRGRSQPANRIPDQPGRPGGQGAGRRHP